MNGQAEITAGLNPRQLEAVTHGDGPLLVLAGAGSGKTRVLTCRVAYLISDQLCRPDQIAAVTFTNKAASEMRERIEKLTGIEPGKIQVSTFHSFAVKMLRRYGERIGLPRQFTIYDEDDKLSLLKTAVKELGFDIKTVAPRVVRARISDAKAELVGVDEYRKLAGDFITERIARIYELYQRKLSAAAALDFDDLLFKCVELLRSDQELLSRLSNRYHHFLIDEYQDTNRAQYVMAKLLTTEHKNIFAVGDEDQSIYGWRGANINNILDFEKDFPNCKIVRLEQNYRSTRMILKAASTMIDYNKMRKGKTLYSEGDVGEALNLLITESGPREAEEVAERIERQIAAGIPRREIAILYRTNAQSRAMEESLKRRFVPYIIVGGLRFYQRKEIKDVLAYLKLLDNLKDDVSFRRIINYPKRGIGATTVAKLDLKAVQQGCSLAELASQKSNLDMLTAATAAKIGRFTQLISYLREKSTQLPLEPFVGLVAENSGIIADLQTDDPIEAEARLENIAELASSAGEYQDANENATLADFLAEISLYTDLDSYDNRSDSVTLMTLHAAKGLEFDSVFVAGLEEGLLPISRSLDDPAQLEEERRLMYVGMTRARKKLTISYALSRARFGETLSLRSRFVDEIPDELLNTERCTLLDSHGVVNSDYSGEPEIASDDRYSAIRVGSTVYHPRWGEGAVMQRGGIGDTTEFVVRFTYAGTKKLLARYAKLKLVR